MESPSTVHVASAEEQVLAQLAHWLARTDSPEEATQAARRAIELAPNQIGPHMALAELLRAQKKWAEAEGELERVIAINPDAEDVYLTLARYHAWATQRLLDAVAPLGDEDGVRIYDGHALRFGCRCSRERVETMLRSLPREEVQELKLDDGRVEVTCQLCSTDYHFTDADLDRVYGPAS